MIVRVLPQLESREEWIAFCRRETPYCLVDTPACLVDFQSHFLQLTLFGKGDPVRYTLGSRSSMDPAWQLIKRCQWSLSALVKGLNTLDFGGNVRDNELLGVHSDLSARRSRPRDPHLHAPASSRHLAPLKTCPTQWDGESVKRLLANRQYRDWRCEQEEMPLGPVAVLLDLLDHNEDWQAQPFGPRLQLAYRGKVLASLITDLNAHTSGENGTDLIAGPGTLKSD
ncbi:hypothetical protein [Marinobacterium sediminicola]|uniref:Uncharacterized protein n=1 Tax=Marinobacterium sediminicola TaxID=518898 RepID=A0ABY1RYE9_9GAMM|nr:hypothetical protein [Marinobacterium sediminicola]ULG68144.1 hypothetical protein LN244_10530 [Marinobacterium sediminicola]SMR73343.1 hypothetical protein SAMN04487964_1045 [Marinobacterium sediminicola]